MPIPPRRSVEPPPPPYRLIRAHRHTQDALVALEHHRKDFDPDDMDLHRAVDHLLSVRMILAARIRP